jgi:hypothetical protein
MTVPEVIKTLQPIFRDFNQMTLAEGSFRATLAGYDLAWKPTDEESQDLAFSLVEMLIKEIGEFQERKLRCSQCAMQMGIAFGKLLVAGRVISKHGDELRVLMAEYLHAAIYPRPLSTAMVKFIEAMKWIDERRDVAAGLRDEMVVERDALKEQLGKYIADQQAKTGGGAYKGLFSSLIYLAFMRSQKISLANGYLVRL